MPQRLLLNVTELLSRGYVGVNNQLLNSSKIEKPPSLKLWRLKRRLGDSNPRYSFPYTHFPGVLLKPLGQVS